MTFNPEWSRSRAYIEAQRKARLDLDNWPEPASKPVSNREKRDVLGILCAGLSVAIVLIWWATYIHVRNNPPSPTITIDCKGV